MHKISRFLMLCLIGLTASCQASPPVAPLPAPKPEEKIATPDVAPGVKSETSEVRKDGAPVIDADFAQEFLEIFNEIKECRDIRLHAREPKTRADFKVQIMENNDDVEPQWLWTVRDARDEIRGIGNQTSAAFAVRDMCTTIREGFRRRS